MESRKFDDPRRVGPGGDEDAGGGSGVLRLSGKCLFINIFR